jgi:D-alanyl-D-alanine carboxypeptidase
VNYLALVPIPPKSELNLSLTSPDNAFMKGVLGEPVLGGKYDPAGHSTPIDNPAFMPQVGTIDVGPFKARGLKIALASLIKVFTAVQHNAPELYQILRSDGMLVARFTKIRQKDGSLKIGPNISNHSWGTAIDIKFQSATDKQGDGKTLAGLLTLSTFFNAFGWYWGAGFKTEDSMHFEVSKEKLGDWDATGLLKK